MSRFCVFATLLQGIGTISYMRWKCPMPDCPPTDIAPVDCTSYDDPVLQSICGGQCGQVYPAAGFKHVQ